MYTHSGVLSLALLGAPQAAPAQGPVTVVAIRHVTVIDGTGAAPLPDATVVIRSRHIESITPARRVRIPAGAVVIDGVGKYLIPGLIDTHVHIAALADTSKIERFLALALAYGVTGIRDASGRGRERELVDLRTRIDRGDVHGPRYTLLAIHIALMAGGQDLPLRGKPGVDLILRTL